MKEHSLESRAIRFCALFILPLFFFLFVPWVQDYYDTGRLILVTGLTIIILFLWTIDVIRKKQLAYSANAGSIGFGLVSLVAIASIIFISSNKTEALTNPLGPVLWLDLFVFSAIVPPTLEKQDAELLRWIVAGCIAFLGLCIVYQQFSITAILFPQASYLTNTLWNPTGSPVSAILLFVGAMPLSLSLLRNAMHRQEDRNTAFSLIFLLLLVAGAGITIWRFVSVMQTVLLPLPLGWTVLLETWKQWIHAILGIGAERFTDAFTTARPASVNMTLIWNTMFSTNASLVFHLGVVYGMTGVAAFVTFSFFLFKTVSKQWEERIALWFIILACFLLPPSVPFLLFIMLFILSHSAGVGEQYKLTAFGTAVISAIAILFVILGSFGWYRFTAGEYLFQQALSAAQNENNGTKAYNSAILAMRQNPTSTRFHQSFSQINLMLAQAVIAAARQKEASETAKLTDDDQKLVIDLLTQAVREAKTATTLAPDNVYAWSNLASVYQNLIGSAAEADQWTIAAYQKAITLDPTNPVLRLDLGGVYVGMKDYDNAIQQFATAVTLKPNYANGYYNLGNAFKFKGDITQARAALNQVLLLTPKNAAAYEQVTQEVKNLERGAPVESSPSTQPLIVPELSLPQ